MPKVVIIIAFILGLSAVLYTQFTGEGTRLKRELVSQADSGYEGPTVDGKIAAQFIGRDAQRQQIPVQLQKVGEGFPMVTAMQFIPSQPDTLIVLTKNGLAHWLNIQNGEHGQWAEFAVRSESEQGLLGLAFHPKFPEDKRIFFNHIPKDEKREITRVSSFEVMGEQPRQWALKNETTVIEIEQPYPNHNGGHLAFGPDGYLYIGLGDGGWRDDPHGHGQNRKTLLGAMLRLDIDKRTDALAYGIPGDNPFVDQPALRPEIWAYGLRNPWRYAFAPDGRLVVADVGQNKWEEVSMVSAGDNLGWRIREGSHCFDPKEGCQKEGLVDPIFDYDHDAGRSITGGEVYEGQDIPKLKGKYLFADFVEGKLWAMHLPKTENRAAPQPEVYALGKWPILPSTFAKHASGALFIADFGGGHIYQVVSPSRAD